MPQINSGGLYIPQNIFLIGCIKEKPKTPLLFSFPFININKMSAPVDTKPKVEKKPKAPKAPKAKDANASSYPLEVIKNNISRDLCI